MPVCSLSTFQIETGRIRPSTNQFLTGQPVTPEEPSMSESPTTEAPTEPLFEDAELRQFEADDVEAGRAICKMLSLLFIYTVIAMSIVSLWTVCVTSPDHAAEVTTPGH
jgi:hypothetical protein